MQQQFDQSAEQFDLLSLRSFRRDTILQYDATNQSEPLRIALCFFGLLFSLCLPYLFENNYDSLSTNVAAVLGSVISGTLFQNNRKARSLRMGKIDLEYRMGDLRATYRGVRSNRLSELRGKKRVVALVGPSNLIEARVREARVYRRRLSGADAVVVPVSTDAVGSAAAAPVGEAESRWLWAAAEPPAWLAYFTLLLSERNMALDSKGAWLGLNIKGRSFGSALGAPKWDEMLGTALQPTGDGFGDFKEVRTEMAAAAKEAAAASGATGTELADAESTARAVLEAQSSFYEALTTKNVEAIQEIRSGAEVDADVSEALATGARAEPWAAGSQAFPPQGMRATDCDALVLSATEAWTTAIERPLEGGTLLATQRWRCDGGTWRISTHRYIPWDASGATAVVKLLADARGAVLLGREINTREVSQRGAVLPVL